MELHNNNVANSRYKMNLQLFAGEGGGTNDNDNEPDLSDLTPEKVKELITKARTQEKNKLYGQIETNKTQLTQTQAQLQQAQAQLTELEGLKAAKAELEALKASQNKPNDQKPAEDKGTKAVDDAQIKALSDLVGNLTNEIKALKGEVTNTQTKLTEREKQEAAEKAATELAKYRDSVIGDVPPELASLVKGASKEEIDAAVNSLKTGLGKLIPPTPNAANTGTIASMQLKLPGAPENVRIQGSEVTAEMIANMPMDQYAEFRKNNPQFLGAGASGANGGGLSSGGWRNT